MVLRAYAKYLRQAGSTFSQDYMEDTLRNNVHTTRLLVSLFEARMSPERQRAGVELTDALLEELDGALDQVASLDEDRILRSFLNRDQGDPAHQLLPAGGGGEPHELRLHEVRPAGHPGPARRPARRTRSGCTRRGSRACTCASARSRAAVCAGPTGARTSVPRSSAWSRRRW